MIDSGIVQASLVKPGIVGAGLVSPYSRYFRTNDDLSYISIPEVTFSGDFEIEFITVFPVAGGYFFADSSSLDLPQRFGITDSGQLFGVADASVPAWQQQTLDNNLLRHIRIIRESGFAEVFVDGVSAGSVSSLSTITIDSLCRPFAGSTSVPYLNGIIANVLMYDNGTLVRNYPINDNSNTIADISGNGQNGSVVNGNASDWELFNQQADGDWLGQELWDGILSAIGDGWADNGDGSYSCDGTQVASTQLRIDNKVSQGNEYRVSGLVQSISSGTVALRAGDGTTGPITSPGQVSDDQTPTTADPHLRIQGDSSLVGVVSDPSFKRLLRTA